MKVLVVDDSALMRRQLTDILTTAGMRVETARNGTEALELVARFQPDVVTLDVAMPEMDGLSCLKRIMAESPRPVVMISALTDAGAETSMEALRLGAVEVVHKQGVAGVGLRRMAGELVRIVQGAAGARLRRAHGLRERLQRTRASIVGDRELPSPAVPRPGEPAETPPDAAGPGVVLVGVSTGGPSTLEEIIPQLPADVPWPLVVAQHMPPTFTATLARRLDDISALKVVEAAQPTALEPGMVCIARGGADAVLTRRAGRLVVQPVPADPARPWHPSVDRLVESAVQHVEPSRLVGVLLTGMGVDGGASMAGMHARGGRTIAESEASAVVFGMPADLIRRGGADVVLPAEQVAGQLVRWLKPAARG
ncbi:chemotaxis-specific protein-glutamate methyltransferase CheB [Azospirillum sp. TSO22-1]|uniref:chemotaxis-specific protein-glutamate methyltransferase CheB n=1 Tax=Azospirillum sp. TSO22-1 TaxID=716789 RepID=UPI000D60C10D|nr:chemotaxis-specific protein-glutamate methyltransferase CheB [Azospirillum sp. TSO22-1]PWC56622.1 chemotaxis protein CheY [Azospirillum sp. TSO22-1]